MLTHPSRSAPKCVDCRHLQNREFCNHPQMPVSGVTGEPTERAKYARAVTPEKAALAGIAVCGPEGLLFSSAVADGVGHSGNRGANVAEG